jgi:hypothetical protein
MQTNEKAPVQTAKASSVQPLQKATQEKKEKPSYKAPKIREIDPAGVLYAVLN